MNYIVITKKKWSKKNFEKLNNKIIVLNEIKKNKIKKIGPKIIFFLHWSKLIPEDIYNKYLCIQFHTSDLPKGRGGSPIQNQILKNIEKTKITAFKVSEKIDAGPICMKEKFELKGNAQTIYKRMEAKCLDMIEKLIKRKNIRFKKQIGHISYFKRRKPSESKINLKINHTINGLYNFLRMLDAPGYPNAFIKLKDIKFRFNHIRKKNNTIEAKVIITKNEK